MIESQELKEIKADFEKCKSIMRVAKKYHRAPKAIAEVLHINNNCRVRFCAPYIFPPEMQQAHKEIKNFLKKVRESKSYS